MHTIYLNVLLFKLVLLHIICQLSLFTAVSMKRRSVCTLTCTWQAGETARATKTAKFLGIQCNLSFSVVKLAYTFKLVIKSCDFRIHRFMQFLTSKLICLLACLYRGCPSQQFFNHVGTEPWFPGY